MKRRFESPAYTQLVILNVEDETVVGTIRLKPTTIMWKPKGGKKFYAVTLDEFVDWITDPQTKARRLKQ
jgi:hypothetical protein